jgi:hypothetical protein
MRTTESSLLTALQKAHERILNLENALKESGEYAECNHCDRIRRFREGTPTTAPTHLKFCGNWCMECVDSEDGFDAFTEVLAASGDFLVAYAIAPLFETVAHRFVFHGNAQSLSGRVNRDAEQWMRDYANKRDPWGTMSEWRREPVSSLEMFVDFLAEAGRAESVLDQVAKIHAGNQIAGVARKSLDPKTIPTWVRQTGAYMTKEEARQYDREFKAAIEAKVEESEAAAA